MRLRRLALGAATAAGLLLAAGTLWASAPASTAAWSTAQDETDVHNGKIKALDLKENKFTLSIDERAMREMIIIINPRTEYTLNGEESTRDDALQVGAEAKVICRAKSPVALSVDVTTE